MKKTIAFLSIVAAMLVTTNIQAQSKALNLTSTGDTLNAASAADTSISLANNVGYYSTVTFYAVVSKVSGSPTGIALLQVSGEGGTWFDLNTDTLTITNQTTNKKRWVVNLHEDRNYRVWMRLATGVAVPHVTGYFNKPKNY